MAPGRRRAASRPCGGVRVGGVLTTGARTGPLRVAPSVCDRGVGGRAGVAFGGSPSSVPVAASAGCVAGGAGVSLTGGAGSFALALDRRDRRAVVAVAAAAVILARFGGMRRWRWVAGAGRSSPSRHFRCRRSARARVLAVPGSGSVARRAPHRHQRGGSSHERRAMRRLASCAIVELLERGRAPPLPRYKCGRISIPAAAMPSRPVREPHRRYHRDPSRSAAARFSERRPLRRHPYRPPTSRGR
jgi:hypothetical protein